MGCRATLQAATVVGSIMFYQEYKRMSVIDLCPPPLPAAAWRCAYACCAVMTAVGVLFITGGIVVSPNPGREICETVALTFGAAQAINNYRELLEGGPRMPVSPNPGQRQNLRAACQSILFVPGRRRVALRSGAPPPAPSWAPTC